MRSRVPILFAVWIIFGALAAPAEYRPVRGSVLVILRSTSAEEDQEFRSLMLNVIRVEVEDRELEMLLPAAPPPDGEQPLASAVAAGAEFALVGAYATSAQEASFDLTWYDAAAAAASAMVSRKSALDFTLDVAIASAVVELLDGQKERIAALPLKPDPNAKPVAVAPPAEAAPPPPGQAVLGKDVVRLRPLKPLMITIGAAPLISTFNASDFISTVYLGLKTTAAWRFPMLGGAGGIGIVSGWQRYHVENILNAGWFQTIPLGIQAQFGTRTPGPFDFIFHLDGGVIFWFLDPDVGNASNGVVPFVQGGVGFIVNVFENLGIVLDLNYSDYFFRNPDFTFLEPSIALVLRF